MCLRLDKCVVLRYRVSGGLGFCGEISNTALFDVNCSQVHKLYTMEFQSVFLQRVSLAEMQNLAICQFEWPLIDSLLGLPE